MTKSKLADGINAMLMNGFRWKPASRRNPTRPETLWTALVDAVGTEGAHKAYWDILDNEFDSKMRYQSFNGWEDHPETTKDMIEQLLRRLLLRLG